MADPLATLRDIHLPPAEPTPLFYYVLFCLLLLLFILSAVLIYRKIDRNKKRVPHPKHQALSALYQLKKDFDEKKYTPQQTAQNISILLKQLALQYYPREEIAGLQGKAWFNFLFDQNQTLNASKIDDIFIEAMLKPPSNEYLPLDEWFDFAERWIKQRRKICLK